MATATFNNTVIQVHKTLNKQRNSVHYYIKIFPDQKPVKAFEFEYTDGHFELNQGDATQREKDFMIHCIQAMELSETFPC